jgi:hypothetical protein
VPEAELATDTDAFLLPWPFGANRTEIEHVLPGGRVVPVHPSCARAKSAACAPVVVTWIPVKLAFPLLESTAV